jgi:hypothetical protein
MCGFLRLICTFVVEKNSILPGTFVGMRMVFEELFLLPENETTACEKPLFTDIVFVFEHFFYSVLQP